MDIKARQKGSIIILDLSGRIDVDAASLIEIVGQCLRDGYLDILCNFESVEFLDYMGVSAIALAYKDVMNHKGRMKFVHVPVHLKNILAVAGLDRVIDLYPSEETALQSFQEDRIIEKIKKLQLRRRFKRLTLDMKIDIKSKHDAKAACAKAEILNLSGIGAYLHGCSHFKLGDEIILRLELPPKHEELHLEALVVWLSDKQIQPAFHPAMGIEFHNISTADQQKLLDFIDRNLSHSTMDI